MQPIVNQRKIEEGKTKFDASSSKESEIKFIRELRGQKKKEKLAIKL